MDKRNAAKLILPIFLLAGLDQLPIEHGNRSLSEPAKETCPNCGGKFIRKRANWNFCKEECYKEWLEKQRTEA